MSVQGRATRRKRPEDTRASRHVHIPSHYILTSLLRHVKPIVALSPATSPAVGILLAPLRYMVGYVSTPASVPLVIRSIRPVRPKP